MADTSIFLPSILLAAFTILVMFRTAFYRVSAVKSGEVSHKVFYVGKGTKDLPDRLIQMHNHYQNLLDLPVLFYIWTVVVFITGIGTDVALYIAWAFFATRVVHSIIHLGSNSLLPRMYSFGLGALILLGAWCWLGVELYL